MGYEGIPGAHIRRSGRNDFFYGVVVPAIWISGGLCSFVRSRAFRFLGACAFMFWGWVLWQVDCPVAGLGLMALGAWQIFARPLALFLIGLEEGLKGR